MSASLLLNLLNLNYNIVRIGTALYSSILEADIGIEQFHFGFETTLFSSWVADSAELHFLCRAGWVELYCSSESFSRWLKNENELKMYGHFFIILFTQVQKNFNFQSLPIISFPFHNRWRCTVNRLLSSLIPTSTEFLYQTYHGIISICTCVICKGTFCSNTPCGAFKRLMKANFEGTFQTS